MSPFRRRRKAMAVLAIVNAAGVPAVINMPFLPNGRALIFASCFAAASSLLLFLHMRSGYRESSRDPKLAAEFESARILRYPLITTVSLSLLLGSFGFYSASFAMAGGYTYAFGSESTQRFTISRSEWASGKYGNCYKTRFHQLSGLFQLWGATCIQEKFDVGDSVNVRGKASWFGTFATKIARADS